MKDPWLKGCPFCGGKGKLRIDNMMIKKRSERCAWVYCTKCNARTGYYLKRLHRDGYVDHAIDAWNSRWREDE